MTYDSEAASDRGYRVKVQARDGAPLTYLWGGAGIVAAPTLPPTLLTVRVDDFGEEIAIGRVFRDEGLKLHALGRLRPAESFTFDLNDDKTVAVYAKCVTPPGAPPVADDEADDANLRRNVDTFVWCCLHVPTTAS